MLSVESMNIFFISSHCYLKLKTWFYLYTNEDIKYIIAKLKTYHMKSLKITTATFLLRISLLNCDLFSQIIDEGF